MKYKYIPKDSRIAVGLSGGVDSAVSAYLLKEAGYEIVGVHMQCWDYDAKGCTGKRDRADAVEVASLLGINFISLDFQHDYKKKVLDNFFQEYRNGRTPNPDILCNKEIKFGLFLNWALENGFSHIATGHYASIVNEDFVKLKIPADKKKDQTYFLYRLGQEELSHSVFPLGDYKKEQVRDIASELKLPVANKDESFGICFIGDVDLREFLTSSANFVPKKGNVFDLNGQIIGTHMGAYSFTIGQRHGFTVNQYQGIPRYVLKKDVGKNEITVGSYRDCMTKFIYLSDIHWMGKSLNGPIECDCRIRHLGKLYPCKLDTENMTVTLFEDVFAVASGQSAVFYKSGVVLGGGIIA